MEELPVSERKPRFDSAANTILHLQHTIGNRAVQRLMREAIQGDLVDAVVPAAIQRAPEDAPRSMVVLNLVLGRSGKVKGTSRVEGHEDKIEVLSVSLKEESSARRSVIFNKETDASSPILAEAMTRGDSVQTAEFTFLRRADNGSFETAHTLEFSDGHIASYSTSGGENGGDTVELDFAKREE
jgi:type VI protein secretion system component Hcp